MPLSKARDRERKRLAKVRLENEVVYQPSVLPEWVAEPNAYLSGHLRVCPGYDPLHPGDHFDQCPFIDPLFQPNSNLNVRPDVISNWYAGARPHFGIVRSRRYAEQFLSALFEGRL